MIKIKNNNLGQSLVELILAIVVIEIGLFSVWSMFLVNYNSEREAQLRILGANLAREGVELIKNTRDSNWLKVMANVTTGDNPPQPWLWDQGFDPGSYSLDALNKELTKVTDDNEFVQLYLNDDGFYGVNNTGSLTPYRRAITLKNICCDSTDNVSCTDNEIGSYLVEDSACNEGEIKIGIKVISEVQWTISGNSRSFTTELNLYNWQ